MNGKETPTEVYITDHINRFALEFLQNCDRARPFALMVGHKAVHSPFEPSPKHKDLFNNQWFDLPPTWDDTYEGRPPYLQARRRSPHGLDGLPKRADLRVNEFHAFDSSPGPWIDWRWSSRYCSGTWAFSIRCSMGTLSRRGCGLPSWPCPF